MTNSDRHLKSSLDHPTSVSWWQQKSIRFKTTVLAIAISTIPTVVVGSVAYYFAARSVDSETTALRKTLVTDLQNQVNVFMSDRFNDIQVIANLDLFANPKLNKIASTADKTSALEAIQAAHSAYNSIGVFDIKGNVIAQTGSKPLGNHLNRGYVQAALKADGAVISQPSISTTSGIYSVYTASPIKDQDTGETIGFVRARIPVAVLKNLLTDYTTNGGQYYLLNNQGEIFLGSAGEYVSEQKSDNAVTDQKFAYNAVKASQIFAGADNLLNSGSVAAEIATNTISNQEQFLTFAPAKSLQGLPSLNWQAVIATDSAIVFAPQRNLRWVFFLGTGIVALGVAAIAYSLANKILRPILAAADAVAEIGRGNFKTNLQITGADEIAQLGTNINGMSAQLMALVETQTLIAQHSEAVRDIALQSATANEQLEIAQIAVTRAHHSLTAQRVIYYQFASTGGKGGKVIAESVSPGSASLLDTNLAGQSLAAYYQGQPPEAIKVEVINDLAQANTAIRGELKSLGIKACLIVPVSIAGEIDGLLMAHRYDAQSPWRNEEVELMTQVASQISFAAARLEFLEQQKQGEIREKSAREAIQSRAFSLLQEVDDVSAGNLTIRAKVTPDEIGTIADSYNSTIESLQKLVNQTKVAAQEVQSNTAVNDEVVQQLAQAATVQAAEIAQMLEQVEAMAQSSDLVLVNAAQAESFIAQANATIEKSDLAMNQTVAEINLVKNTVVETASKAEKLGISSQEISQAVNLISRFAAQTHLLALKASIEAARAGEQGKGFAVIADEVRSLATQSAEATAQIETLVNKIQLEANVLVDSMNQGTEQIAAGSELVQQTRHSLTEVNHVSQELSKLVSLITQAANLQSATSAQVSQGMIGVAQSAQNNSQSANQVSGSIKELSTVAAKLQSDIGKFKT